MEKDYLSSPSFKPEIIRSKSGAAAGLCGWVVNICKYFRIYQVPTLSTRWHWLAFIPSWPKHCMCVGTAQPLTRYLPGSCFPCHVCSGVGPVNRQACITCCCPSRVRLKTGRGRALRRVPIALTAVVEGLCLQVVAPKRAALAEANKRLEGANKKLSGIRAHVAELRERVALLEASLMKVPGVSSAPMTCYGGC